MNWTPYLFLGLGLLLIFIEFFLPGGVMGAAGGVFIIVSIVFFVVQAQSLLAVILYLLATLFFVGVLMRFALWRLRKGNLKGIYLNSAQEGYFASEYAKDLIGKEGKAFSDLKPSGHILVEGKRYQAVSKVGYVTKGTEIVVVGGEGGHLIVKKITKEGE